MTTLERPGVSLEYVDRGIVRLFEGLPMPYDPGFVLLGVVPLIAASVLTYLGVFCQERWHANCISSSTKGTWKA